MYFHLLSCNSNELLIDNEQSPSNDTLMGQQGHLFPIDLFSMGHLLHSTKTLFEQHPLCRGTTLHRNHFAQESLCPGTSLHRSYFAQEPLSTGTTLHINHIAQEPIQELLCPGTTLHRNRFVQRSSMAK